MRIYFKIESITASLINIMIFTILVIVFIMFFFYPDTFGTILGKIRTGIINLKK
jgi:hypothetical protein